MTDQGEDKAAFQDAQATTTVSRKGFAGLFSGLELPDLIQMLAMNAFTGMAVVRRGDHVGELFFKRGDIVHARFHEKQGAEAFEDILTWPEGEIVLEPGVTPPRETIETPWHALLIHTMARVEDKKAGMVHHGQDTAFTAHPASELMRLRAIHKSTLTFSGVTSCIIGTRVPPIPLCPTQDVAKLRKWFEVLVDLYTSFDKIRPPGSQGGPTSVWALLEERGWLLVELENYLVAVELSKASNIQEMEKLLRRLWQGKVVP